MTRPTIGSGNKPEVKRKPKSKEERLAAALRANLKRRKEQGRSADDRLAASTKTDGPEQT